MQTASDLSACSGVICRPDPTIPVEPSDVVAEQPIPECSVEVELPQLPPPPPSAASPLSDGLLSLMLPESNLEIAHDLEMIAVRRPRRKALVVALGTGLATVTGILLALAAQRHISAPTPAEDVPDSPLQAVRLKVGKTARRLASVPYANRQATAARQSAAARQPRRSTAKVNKRAARRPRRATSGQPRARLSARRSPKRLRRTPARARALRRHLLAARKAARRSKWRVARRHARRALRIDRRNRTARRLARRARAGIKRQRAIAQQLRRAHSSLKRRQWRRARQQARAVLRVDPRNRRARAIKRRAEARLRRARRG